MTDLTLSHHQTLALFTLLVPVEAVLRWVIEWNIKVCKKPHYNKASDRLLRITTSVIGNLGEALFAPILLAWMVCDYVFRIIRHRWFGGPHPYSMSKWK